MSLRKICSLALTSLLLMSATFAQPHAPDTLWTRDYSDSARHFCPNAAMATADGGFALAGTWGDYSWANNDCGVLKMDASGSVQWRHRFGLPEVQDYAWDGLQTRDGGFFLAGYSAAADSAVSGLVAVKYDSEGDSLWSLPVRPEGAVPMMQAVTEDYEGNLVMGGVMDGNTAIVWVTSSGSLLRYRSYAPFPANFRVHGICQTAGHGIVLVGDMMTMDSSIVTIHGGAMCVDSAGNLLWTRWFPEQPADSNMAFWSVIPLTDGSVAVSATRYGSPSARYSLLLFDAQGDLLWMRAPDLPFIPFFNTSVCLVADFPEQGFVLAAPAYDPNVGNYCNIMFKLNSQGDLMWWYSYPRGLPENVRSRSLAVAPGGGYVWALYDNTFFTVVRLGPDTSESAVQQPLTPRGFSLTQNYPNPFNPTTEITFELPRAANTTLKVYDVMGREVTELLNGHLSVGEHRLTFDASDLPSGVYFYRLQAGTETQTRKMLLLK